jgi:hypothetical protein
LRSSSAVLGSAGIERGGFVIAGVLLRLLVGGADEDGGGGASAEDVLLRAEEPEENSINVFRLPVLEGSKEKKLFALHDITGACLLRNTL